MDELFVIERQKAEQDLQAVTARARPDEESATRIAAIRAPATAVAPTGPTRSAGEEEETSLGEISQIILSRYPGLPKAVIATIHENCFKPENIYKFRLT